MGTNFYLGVLILAVAATIVAEAEVKVFCETNSVRITWRLSPNLVPHAGRLFLGKCMSSKLSTLPNGEADAHFDYQFSQCNFKRLMKGKNVIFQNELTYRPYAKPNPAAIVYPIECVYRRPEGWVPAFLNPGSGASEGQGGLVFHLALLNEELNDVAKTNVVPMGSFMPIWASVEEKSHQPLLLLMEECVVAFTPELHPTSRVYPIISNKGCLTESTRRTAFFLPRYESSAIVLYMQAIKFDQAEVYIHCKLVAWDPTIFDESKKACHYVTEEGKYNGRWELLDNPNQSSICSCCDSTCGSRHKRRAQKESHGNYHRSVLGPLIIMDPSESKEA